MTVQQTTFLIRIGGLTCICMSLGIFSFILFANDKQYQSHQNWSQTHNLSQMLTLTCVTFIRDNSTGSRDRESQGWIKRWLTFSKRHSQQQWFFRPARRFQIFKTILAILSELWLSFSWLFIGNICWITFLPHRVLEITPFLLDTHSCTLCVQPVAFSRSKLMAKSSTTSLSSYSVAGSHITTWAGAWNQKLKSRGFRSGEFREALKNP